MNRNHKSNVKKERIIMIASSALVLGALTMTGLYLRSQEAKEQDDGYTLDIGALEESIDNKADELAKAETSLEEAPDVSLEDDLDYMPMEAGSDLVEIPGLTDDKSKDSDKTDGKKDSKTTGSKDTKKDSGKTAEESVPSSEGQTADAQDVLTGTENPEVIAEGELTAEEPVAEMRELHFPETLVRPVSGEVLIPYSMNSSVYFATLDQYKYNPAVIYDADEGTVVTACAEGQVLSVFTDSELGNAVTLDLGDGYTATYGQLTGVSAVQGDYVDAGAQLGTVAAPTKYYSAEGANLYFRLEKDGAPVNPEGLFQ